MKFLKFISRILHRKRNGVQFFEKNPEVENPDTKTVVVPVGIKSKVDLIQLFIDKWDFPDYSNTNWDSFYANLTDLEWIKEANVRIIHLDVPLSEGKDRDVYFKILKNIMTYWFNDQSHHLEISFPLASKKELEKRGLLEGMD
ncbi:MULTISPECIES: barstar family protein [Parachlamydia]|uniref:barstar family protein n=1 Tax=Parachlamydia TaxID=83551 RepID=UPI0024E2450A|nr:barstar family protein [Parachlamydia acanthamoebae]